MKRYILLGLITLITFHSFGQGNYKVKPSGSKGEFIIPPDSYWGYRENGKKKCGYDQYYYVLFYGLTKDYLKTISELYYTEYWSGNIDYFAKTKLPKHKNNLLNRKIKEQNAQLINLSSFKSTSSGKPFQCSPLDDKNSVYFIQTFNPLTHVIPYLDTVKLLTIPFCPRIWGVFGKAASFFKWMSNKTHTTFFPDFANIFRST